MNSKDYVFVLFTVLVVTVFLPFTAGFPVYPSESDSPQNSVKHSNILPSLYIITNSSYNVGFFQAETFGPQIADCVSKDAQLNEKLIPWYESKEGREVYDKILATNTKFYPQYIEELSGLADGSGIPFYALFLKAVSPEVSHLLKSNHIDSCSDIYVNYHDQQFLIHNEDGGVDNYEAYLLHVTEINEKGEEKIRYSAYVYPGLLPGMSLGWNSKLESVSVEDAINRVTQGCAFGFNVNIAAIGIAQYELKEIRQGHSYNHFNNYKVFNISAESDTSSVHRQERADEFPEPKTEKNALAILGDTFDEKYPIYRDVAGNGVCTLATASFDMENKIVKVFRDNPKTGAVVVHSLGLV